MKGSLKEENLNDIFQQKIYIKTTFPIFIFFHGRDYCTSPEVMNRNQLLIKYFNAVTITYLFCIIMVNSAITRIHSAHENTRGILFRKGVVVFFFFSPPSFKSEGGGRWGI